MAKFDSGARSDQATDGERATTQPGSSPAGSSPESGATRLEDERPAVTGDGQQPTVRLERVSKHFGELVAVRDLDLDIGSGEFFTLLGPSGCGKTTTLRMVAGFEQPTAGRVLIEGADVAGLPSYKRPTNTVFQSYALFPHLSVRDNVAFGLRRKKVPKDEIKQRVQAELEQTRAVQTAELEQYRTTVLSELAERKSSLEAEVARLEQLEEEHRNRMRDYLTQQLAQLEATPG